MYSISHHCRRKMRASIVVHSGSNSSIVFTKSQTVRCGGRGRCLEAHRGTVPSVVSALPPGHPATGQQLTMSSTSLLFAARIVFSCHSRQVLIAIQSSREGRHKRATVRDRDGRRPDRAWGGLLDVSCALFPFLLQRSGLLVWSPQQQLPLSFSLSFFLPSSCTCRRTLLLSDLSTAIG